jgi:phage N-6-adenine-methyltransferase
LDQITKSGPTINKGKSKQDYGTPKDLLEAVEGRFGKISFDLAADDENHVAPKYFTEEFSSLEQDWTRLQGNLWLNPPFANIEPWANKCFETTGQKGLWWNPHQRIFFLVPASVGSEWYRRWVADKAYVLALSPRLTFVGCKDPYPKDVILAIYGQGLRGFDTWRWKNCS